MWSFFIVKAYVDILIYPLDILLAFSHSLQMQRPDTPLATCWSTTPPLFIFITLVHQHSSTETKTLGYELKPKPQPPCFPAKLCDFPTKVRVRNPRISSFLIL